MKTWLEFEVQNDGKWEACSKGLSLEEFEELRKGFPDKPTRIVKVTAVEKREVVA